MSREWKFSGTCSFARCTFWVIQNEKDKEKNIFLNPANIFASLHRLPIASGKSSTAGV